MEFCKTCMYYSAARERIPVSQRGEKNLPTATGAYLAVAHRLGVDCGICRVNPPAAPASGGFGIDPVVLSSRPKCLVYLKQMTNVERTAQALHLGGEEEPD